MLELAEHSLDIMLIIVEPQVNQIRATLVGAGDSIKSAILALVKASEHVE